MILFWYNLIALFVAVLIFYITKNNMIILYPIIASTLPLVLVLNLRPFLNAKKIFKII